MARNNRTYEDYEELGRYLETAQEAVYRAQSKSFDMFGGLDPLTEDRPVTMEARPAPTSHDKRILDLVVILDYLRCELAMDFQAEISESEVPPGSPRTPPPFDREGLSDTPTTFGLRPWPRRSSLGPVPVEEC